MGKARIGCKELGLHGRGQREGSGTVWEGLRWVGGAETGGGGGGGLETGWEKLNVKWVTKQYMTATNK